MVVASLFLAAVVGGIPGCGGDSVSPSLPPSISSVDPASGTVGTQVAISGASFTPGLTVTFGDLAATSIEVESPGTALVHAPDGLLVGSTYDIRVTNPGGTSDTIEDAFLAVAPELLSVNGVTKPSGVSGSTIIFEGTAFGDLAGKGSVWFTDGGGGLVEASIASDENWTDEFVVTTVPNAAGDGPVWVETATGVTDSVMFKLASGATFSPSLINWTATTPLPATSQGHGAAFLSGENAGTDNVVYVSGGADGALVPRTLVWRAPADPTGSIGVWTSETDLPEARAFHRLLIATPFNALIDTTNAGHAYVMGGIGPDGAPRATVYRAAIGADRSLGPWIPEIGLPEPLHSMGAVIFRSWIFVLGGATTGDVPVTSVYRCSIEEDGSLGPWEAQAPLAEARAYGVAVQFAGVIYFVGGDEGVTAPGSAATSTSQSSEIYYNALDLRSRALGASWDTNPSSLIKSVAKHSAVVAGGTILVSGGVYNGDGNSATEHQYASFGLDGTIESFGGATGSQTIAGSSGAGGQPFFNHAAIVYVDAGGEAHVVILGGNDVTDPTTPLAENYYY